MITQVTTLSCDAMDCTNVYVNATGLAITDLRREAYDQGWRGIDWNPGHLIGNPDAIDICPDHVTQALAAHYSGPDAKTKTR